MAMKMKAAVQPVSALQLLKRKRQQRNRCGEHESQQQQQQQQHIHHRIDATATQTSVASSIDRSLPPRIPLLLMPREEIHPQRNKNGYGNGNGNGGVHNPYSRPQSQSHPRPQQSSTSSHSSYNRSNRKSYENHEWLMMDNSSSTGVLTELSGEAGTGKTQICLSLCVSAVLCREKDVLNAREHEHPQNSISSSSRKRSAPGQIMMTSMTRHKMNGESENQYGNDNHNGNETSSTSTCTSSWNSPRLPSISQSQVSTSVSSSASSGASVSSSASASVGVSVSVSGVVNPYKRKQQKISTSASSTPIPIPTSTPTSISKCKVHNPYRKSHQSNVNASSNASEFRHPTGMVTATATTAAIATATKVSGFDLGNVTNAMEMGTGSATDGNRSNIPPELEEAAAAATATTQLHKHSHNHPYKYEAMYISLGETSSSAQIAHRLHQITRARLELEGEMEPELERPNHTKQHQQQRQEQTASSSSSSTVLLPLESEIKNVMNRIHTRFIHNAEEFMELLHHQLPQMLKNGMGDDHHAAFPRTTTSGRKIGLVVLDSIAGLFRSPEEVRTTAGMGTGVANATAPTAKEQRSNFYMQRSETMFEIAARLKQLSDQYGVHFLVVNQVTSKGGGGGWNERARVVPSLGLSWSHCVNDRYMLKRREGGGTGTRFVRKIELLTSSRWKQGLEARFQIEPRGAVIMMYPGMLRPSGSARS